MSSLETEAERHFRVHEKSKKDRERECSGVDLVEKALMNPQSLSEIQRVALLGRPAYAEDAYIFVGALKGYNRRKMPRMSSFMNRAWSFDRFVHLSPQLCKFTLCDWRAPPDFDRGGDANAAIDELYEEQLRLERENSPLEKARDKVRTKWERCARFYAARALAQYEEGIAEGQEPSPDDVWARFQPQIPTWIQDIHFNNEDYGFVIFESKEARSSPTLARKNWMQVFEEADRDDNFCGYNYARNTVFFGSLLSQHMFPGWAEDCPLHMPSENDPSALRR